MSYYVELLLKTIYLCDISVKNDCNGLKYNLHNIIYAQYNLFTVWIILNINYMQYDFVRMLFFNKISFLKKLIFYLLFENKKY